MADTIPNAICNPIPEEANDLGPIVVEMSNVMERRRFLVAPPEIGFGSLCGKHTFSPQRLGKHNTAECKECSEYVPDTKGLPRDTTHFGVPIPISLSREDAEKANEIYKNEREKVYQTWSRIQPLLKYQDHDNDPKSAGDGDDGGVQ